MTGSAQFESGDYSSSISGNRPDELARIMALADDEPPPPPEPTPYFNGGELVEPDWEPPPLPEGEPEPDWSMLLGTRVPAVQQVATTTPMVTSRGVEVERLGPSSWKVDVGQFASFIFRDLILHRDHHADLTINVGPTRIVRTTTGLSMVTRKTLAKGVKERDHGYATEPEWVGALDMAVDAVIEAVEGLGDGVDLREGDIEAVGPEWVAEPLWCTGASMFVMPGEAGKSTLARAMAVSIVTGRMVVPGLYPRITGPVLYLASEDPGEQAHKRSIDAICRGAGIDRKRLPDEIRLVATNGQALHRLARNIAERARDHAGVVIDAMQGLLPTSDSGVRDSATTFWGAVDEIGKPVFVIAHPNLAQARNWNEADGRAAGAEVSRDRARLSWKGRSTDEPSVEGTYHRRFVLSCTKRNDGPRPPDWAFRRTWSSGMVQFTPDDPRDVHFAARPLTADLQAVVDAMAAGCTTDAEVALYLGITKDAAKKRRQRLPR